MAASSSFESAIQEDSSDVNVWLKEAHDGSEKHQLLIGLHYLKLAELGVNKEENANNAVTWLIAASKQGNSEANEKLKHCVETNLGLNEKNKNDVTWCLTTSVSEKKIRFAARSLFLKLSNAHKKALSEQEYIEAINNLSSISEREKKLLLAAGKKIGSTIGENDFVKTVSKKIQGTLTWTTDEIGETSAAYDSAGIVKKVFVYPRQTASIVFDRGLEYASKEGLSLILSLIPTNQIYLLAMILIYSYLTPGFFLLFLPLLAFYISLFVMVVATLQMFYKKRKQKESTTLVSMLQEQFQVDIDVESTESQYLWNSLTPYLVYFVALPIMVASFSLANKNYIPGGELFVVSLIMTGFCFLGLSDSYDIHTLLALSAHAFASLPVFIKNIPKIPIISSFVGLITNPYLSLELGLGVSFNLSLPSIVHMLIPLLLLRMAMKGSWSGAYRILIPHLVCYFWFSVSITMFPFTTWRSLARATFGYIMLPAAIPISFLLAILGFFYFIYKLLQTQMIGKLLITAMLFAVPVVLTQTKSLFGKKDKNTSAKSKRVQKILMISFAVLGVLPLLFVRIPTLSKAKHFELSWESYRAICIPAENDIWAPYQIRCRDFIGTKVNWKGAVKQVKITKSENTAESVIKSLPTILSDPLYCIYGDRISDCNEASMPTTAFKHCQIVKEMKQTCHLRSHDQFTFSLSMQVEDVQVDLEAGPNFKGQLMALKPNDELEFSGSLVDVGTPIPNLRLRSLNCTSRELPIMMDLSEDVDEDTVYKMLNEAFALTFNFGLFPVFIYSPH
ncbi:unnamed protein product [Lymnaea stagnalis]|uniref:Wolframin n=1 Tax=Lymnaea stagnalis TaxID=6523 RepID=A0AAV2GZ88_LYMST